MSLLLQIAILDKHQRTTNSLQIASCQQTELPHLLSRSSSSKTTTIVRKQRYNGIKNTCKAVHPQKIKSYGRGPEYLLMETPLSLVVPETSTNDKR